MCTRSPSVFIAKRKQLQFDEEFAHSVAKRNIDDQELDTDYIYHQALLGCDLQPA